MIKHSVTLPMTEVRERLARSILDETRLPRGNWLTVLSPGIDEMTLEMTLVQAEGKPSS